MILSVRKASTPYISENSKNTLATKSVYRQVVLCTQLKFKNTSNSKARTAEAYSRMNPSTYRGCNTKCSIEPLKSNSENELPNPFKKCKQKQLTIFSDYVTPSDVELLYKCKCNDLKLPVTNLQEHRFYDFCIKYISNNTLKFREVIINSWDYQLKAQKHCQKY